MDHIDTNQPWHEYRRLILAELERLNHTQDAINTKIDILRLEFQNRLQTLVEKELGEIKVDLAMLRVKAGVWGAIAGLIPAALAIVYLLLKGKGP